MLNKVVKIQSDKFLLAVLGTGFKSGIEFLTAASNVTFYERYHTSITKTCHVMSKKILRRKPRTGSCSIQSGESRLLWGSMGMPMLNRRLPKLTMMTMMK